MGWVTHEKQALVTTLRSAEPTADTLCEGWDVRRLLAHLVQREQGPVQMIKDSVARKPPGEEPGLSRLVGDASSPAGYQDLVTRFVSGPPAWTPMSWAAEKINLIEYVVHHEDIRRGGPTPADPRELPVGQQQAVWGQLGLLAGLALRKAPVGVTLVTAVAATGSAQTRTVKKGDDGVSLVGEPVELALHVNGRRAQAQVEITGSPEAVRRYTEWADAS